MTTEQLKLDLSKHSDVFNDTTIISDSNIIFIYGENGTGKTTIATEIDDQFSDKYNVCKFKDFTSLIGQYKVIGRNGVERDITELSTGEKNTVAILYFIYSLEAQLEKNPKTPLFAIIDDPVNSNDDMMQYMIMTEIKKLYDKDIFRQKSKIIILSHNTHFFLNVRPYGNAKYGKRYSSFNLITGLNEKTNIIRIIGAENDLKTNYDSLWINLVSSYLDNNPDITLGGYVAVLRILIG